MEFIKNNKNVLVVVAIVIIVGAIMLPNRSQDTSETDKKPTTSENKTDEKAEKKTTDKKATENNKKQESAKKDSDKSSATKQATDKKQESKTENKVTVKDEAKTDEKTANKPTIEPKENTDKNTSKQQVSDKSANSESKTAYTFTAKAGDSYTVLARQAIMKYSKANKHNLSKAQIVAAETFLTQDAGSPQINEGQAVSIKKSVVSSVVTKTKALSPSILAGWQAYVPFVNFNL